MIDTIPLPATDDAIDAPFWSATLRSELVVQSCNNCQQMRFPPRPMCPNCQSMSHRWNRLSGDATVWSFAKPRSPLLPAFEKLTPYVVVLAQISEDPSIRIIGNLLSRADGSITGVDDSRLEIGARLRVAFRQCAPDVALPCWVLADESTQASRKNPSSLERSR
jgi:uncharacterized OB-fold protein